MKSSLTLVPSSEIAATTAEQASPAEPMADAKVESEQSDKVPRLRLVGPENQADFIKDALATRVKRKPRKRKAEEVSDGKPSNAVAKTVSEKKVRKPAVRKPRIQKAGVRSEDGKNGLTQEIALTDERRQVLAGMIDLLIMVADAKAESLIEMVVSDLGEEAPVELSGAFEGPVDPAIISDFQEAVGAVLEGFTEVTSPAEPLELSEHNAQAQSSEQIPLKVLGQLMVSLDNDPFEATEWTLFEEQFTSRWYDSKKEAMEGLHAMMVDTGLNYACETKLISRHFSLQDYVYKRYSIHAVVGVYADYQECNDQKQCHAQDVKISEVIVPDAQAAFDKAQAMHKADRRAQMKPDSNLYDNCLKWFSVACFLALALGVIKTAFETGFFG